MPTRKKSNIGRRTRNTVQVQQTRRNEDSARTELRLEENRSRISNSRQSENQCIVLSSWRNKTKSAFSYDPKINYVAYSYVGKMTKTCQYCGALKWIDESPGFCCSSGKVRLCQLLDPPEPLISLIKGEHEHSNLFLSNARSYNSAFQMTSFGAGKIVREGNFMPTFKIQGQVYHCIGSLLPESDLDVKFLQVYFISDYEEQANCRLSIFDSLNKIVILELQDMLHRINPYVTDFKAALQSVPTEMRNKYKFVIDADRKPVLHHSGRYNQPTANEVAVLLVDQQHSKRDIVLHTHGNDLKRISETHRSYDALQYPLLFCYGEDGYNLTIPLFDMTLGRESADKFVSALQFYCFRLMVRNSESNCLHHFRQLFNQFLVDAYAKIETERLNFIRFNQSKLRAEQYVHLQDALRQDGNVENLGRLVILPSSFTGGPRYMHSRTQDAFCYIRKYRRPDLFITFTTNPKWPEITEHLFPGQNSADRQDLISRVFHLKLKKLMSLLRKEEIFGSVKCFIYSVEWQKRGLPHAHILLWLEEAIQPNKIDDVISAEIPNPDSDSILHEIVKKHMIHGPCGTFNNQSPCMKDGLCSKRFPKQLCNDTFNGEDSYPQYKRRSTDSGGFFVSKVINGQVFDLDNRWVVPFSPILSRTFDAHINVEYCSSVQSIKYVTKYVNKGSDQATFSINNEKDEIARFQSGRYISSSEAAWRIFSFPIHERFPAVIHLDVHLENGQRVYFTDLTLQRAVENPKNTTLLAFFMLCNLDPFAASLLYEEVPSYYTFDESRKVFCRRKRGTPVEGYPGIFKDTAIGRVFTVHPSNSECFYLRLLLFTVRGPKSFNHLKTVDNVTHPTFQAACRALNLLEADTHWDDTLQEACISDNAEKLRQLFSIMIVFCHLSNPIELWNKYQRNFSEDLIRDLQRRLPTVNLDNCKHEIENKCLLYLQSNITAVGGHSLAHYGLPEPQILSSSINGTCVTESHYDLLELQNYVHSNEAKLTSEQKTVYTRILSSVENATGEIFFLDAPGGTGKTFLINLIINKIRSQGKIVLPVASSGIASTLLPGGRTAHSTFKIPLNLDLQETPVCNISRNSATADILRRCAVIIWDESTMMHKKSVEALNRTLQDIKKNNKIMGGITVMFSGDFRQTLPVIVRGTRADEVNACLKRSVLWSHITKLSLTKNMRAHIGDDVHAQEFSDILIKLGEGKIPEVNGEIELPTTLCRIVASVDDLISNVYPEIEQIFSKADSWLCERAILTPTNERALSINEMIMDMFHAEEMTYISINTTVDQDDATSYPVEFLNSLSVSGLPAHKIVLKIGVPIILLRNLCPPKLCNGTRLRVKSLQRNVIEATVLTGCAAGDTVFIPRIPIIPNNFPFQFKRLQFPVSVCFAMTINKSQGQTLRIAGLDLRSFCFSHGQLYVGCSRVSSANNLFILAAEEKTHNVVYKEIL